MGTRTLRIDYPDDLPGALGQSDNDFEKEMKFLVAAKLYELGRITSGRAADLAGVSRVEFLETLGKYRVSVFNYSGAELDQELAEARDRAGRRP